MTDGPIAGATVSHWDVPLGTPTRPLWRGRLHLVALALVAPLLALIVLDAQDARARVGVVVYAAGLCSMLAVSTTYHRWVHTIRARAAWRRADHATIFVAIAGTTTPLCLISGSDVRLLWFVWAIAIVGVLAKATGSRPGHHLGNVMYIANGWSGLLILPALWATGHVVATALLVVGGVIYTAGALGFARQWPALRPHVFGYHEVWHAATVAAAGAHLAAVWMVTT